MIEVNSLTDLWKNPEWKKKVKNFIPDKCCEWCGRKRGDIYIDSKGKERKIGLSVHHIEKTKWGLSLYKEVINECFREWYKENKDSIDYEIPRSLSKGEIRDYVKNLWVNENRDLIKEVFEKVKKEILNDYIDLKEEKVIVLCNICHYAREKGLLICPVCKKNYRKKKFPICYECRSK